MEDDRSMSPDSSEEEEEESTGEMDQSGDEKSASSDEEEESQTGAKMDKEKVENVPVADADSTSKNADVVDKQEQNGVSTTSDVADTKPEKKVRKRRAKTAGKEPKKTKRSKKSKSAALPEVISEKSEASGDGSKESDSTSKDADAKSEKSKIDLTKVAKSHRRKNIREVLGEGKLEAETMNAQQEEMERKQRLQEAQQRAHQEMMAARMMMLQKQQNDLRARGIRVLDNSTMCFVPKAAAAPDSFSAAASTSSAGATPDDDDVICLSSEDDEEPDTKEQMDVIKRPTILTRDVIEVLSTSSEGSLSSDDIVMIPSDASEQSVDEGQQQQQDDADNSGAHTNDLFNVPNPDGKVLVNVGHPTDEQDVFLPPQLSYVVKPHQIGGIRFLYDNVVESLNRFQTSNGFGCILAHCMGLGKTLQVVSFTDVFLRYTSAKLVLVIVPINTLMNWQNEYNMWTPPADDCPPEAVASGQVAPRTYVLHVMGDGQKTNEARAKVIDDWTTQGGVLLIGYEMFRLICVSQSTKIGRKGHRNQLQEPSEGGDSAIKLQMREMLLRPDLVICDEGHRIKNSKASTSMALKSIKTRRRVVLTGYPLQNNLLEYWCMVDFVRPNFLGTKVEFSNMFERPIQNGQCVDSTPQDVKLMRYRAHVLHSLLEGFVQRRSHSVLQASLPRKEEHVILVRMTPVQRNLYRSLMEYLLEKSQGTNPLKAFAICCKIWNHPDVLYTHLRDKRSALELIDDFDLDEIKSNSDTASESGKKGRKGKGKRKTSPDEQVVPEEDPYCGFALAPPPLASSSASIGVRDAAISLDWAHAILRDYKPGIMENGPKMAVLFTLIEQTLAVHDRLLVFSQSLFTLSLIEDFLSCRAVPGSSPSQQWQKNKNYYRLDGSTSSSDREKLVNEFNSRLDIHLFLISTRAGSLGINLVGANRVVVFDASWNPCHDAQAVCRVYRYGQTKECHVYRLVTDNSLEKKIYDRQINKQGMSDRIVDEQNPHANLLLKDVTTLISTEEDDPQHKEMSRDTIEQFDDPVLQLLCVKYSKLLTKEPFEHESLLVDQKDQKLTKTEKRLAKQNYDMERQAKAGLRPAPFSYGGPYSYRYPSAARGGYYSGYPAPYQRPIANVRPMIASNYNPSLMRSGSSTVTSVTLTTDLNIPPSAEGGAGVFVPAGQQVTVIKTPSGIFVRTADNKIISIKGRDNESGASGSLV